MAKAVDIKKLDDRRKMLENFLHFRKVVKSSKNSISSGRK